MKTLCILEFDCNAFLSFDFSSSIVCWGCYTNYYKLGSFNNRNVHSFEGQTSELKMRSVLVPLEGSEGQSTPGLSLGLCCGLVPRWCFPLTSHSLLHVRSHSGTGGQDCNIYWGDTSQPVTVVQRFLFYFMLIQVLKI